jgi:hypothetical protein
VQRDKVLEQIAAAEARKQAITDLYCSPGFFERTSKDEVAALEAEQAALGPRIEALMAEWEELEKEIEAGRVAAPASSPDRPRGGGGRVGVSLSERMSRRAIC